MGITFHGLYYLHKAMYKLDVTQTIINTRDIPRKEDVISRLFIYYPSG